MTVLDRRIENLFSNANVSNYNDVHYFFFFFFGLIIHYIFLYYIAVSKLI